MASAPPVSKVTLPAPSGYYPRKRLFRLLDKARKAPVIWVTGPPGCGKTTLVTSYIDSRRLPCLWYKVDEGDADLATFFYYLGLAAKKAAPRKKRRLPLLTPDRYPGLSVFTHRYFESLSAILLVPSLLVLDDCHRVQEDSPFFGTLQEGVSRLAPGIGAVLVSRNDPNPSFARDRANRVMEVVGWKDLRLTPEETAEIVKLQRRGKYSPGLAKDLFKQTDGWAAGLVLLLKRSDRERVEPRAIGRQMPAEIIDYFGSEIFWGLEGEHRNFLLRTAFLPRMTASMAERLTGWERAGRILSAMNRQNLFTEKLPGREPVYVYHSLFREFLLDHAKDSLTGEIVREIRNTAAAILGEAGYVEDAEALYRLAGNWESLARLILSQARSLVSHGRYQTLLDWMGALPEEVVAQEPWLLYWNGVSLMPFSQRESQARFEAALAQFDARGEAPGVFLAWSGVVDAILTRMENLTALDAWTSLLPSLLEKHGDLPSGDIGDRVTCSMYRALFFRQHPRSYLKQWTPRALAVAETTMDLRLKVELGMACMLGLPGLRDEQEAERRIASLREDLKRPDTTPLMRLWVDVMDVTVSIILAKHERVISVASEGLACAEENGVRFVDSYLLGWGAMAALQLREFETANRFLGRMQVVPGTSMWGKTTPAQASRTFHFLAACEALYRQEPEKAVFHAKESLRLLEEGGATTYLPTTHLLVSHAHHALGKEKEAAWHLSQARRIGSEIESQFHVWLSALTEAYFHLEKNDDASSVHLLRGGLRIGREHGFFGTFLWRPGWFEKVAAKALEEGIEVDYVKELIRRNRLSPDSANLDAEHWPWPVKIHTLGRFGLLADDHPVEFGRKVQQRPLSLLKVLIALGGSEVSEARLTELLWPDSDGDLAHLSFTSALNRLRKLLGKEEALVLKEGRLSLSNRHCWVDVWAFDRSLGQAEKARREGKRAEVIRMFEKALIFYRGPFLPFEEMAWATSPREKLRSRFLAAVTRLGRSYEESECWEEAASCYRKGLETDELAEELYRRLMICHFRRGQKAEALSVYRSCRKTLFSVLGVEPSGETQAIAASLGRSTV